MSIKILDKIPTSIILMYFGCPSGTLDLGDHMNTRLLLRVLKWLDSQAPDDPNPDPYDIDIDGNCPCATKHKFDEIMYEFFSQHVIVQYESAGPWNGYDLTLLDKNDKSIIVDVWGSSLYFAYIHAYYILRQRLWVNVESD